MSVVAAIAVNTSRVVTLCGAALALASAPPPWRHRPRRRRPILRPRPHRPGSRAVPYPASAPPVRPTRRPASSCCGPRARRRACSARRGATTRPACGCRTAAAPSSPPGRSPSRSRRSRSRSRTFPTSASCSSRREGRDLLPAVQLCALPEPAQSRRRPTSTRSATPRRCSAAQDIQLQKFFAPFSGWFLTPKMRYYLYVWSSNPSQGDPAQVVGAGNLSWTFNRFVTVGAGITSLPSVRSTEGQFPYWLGVDDRLIADEFFRGSYTSGVWLKGELAHQGQVHGDVRQQPEHARRERGAARQPARHAVLLAAVAADHRRVRAVGHVRRLRRSPEGGDAASACTSPTASRRSKASRAPRASRTARSGSPTAASSSRRICSGPGSPSTR